MNVQIKPTVSAGRLVQPERVPEGFLILAADDAWSWRTFLMGGLWLSIWCGASFPMFALSLTAFLTNPGVDTLFPVLFVGMFAVIGVIGLGVAARWLRIIAKLKPGEAILPTYPLRLGESCRIRYRRRLRRGITPRTGAIAAKWVCYEWVQYTQGTDTVTKTHTLSEVNLPDTTVSTGTRLIQYEAKVSVPVHGPPSFYADHNQLRWELQVTIDLPGIAKDTSHFQITVTPEAMR